MSFENLELRPELLKALKELGHTSPTPIQEKAIPVILSGKDVIGTAQTGTGKTGAYLIPIIQKLMDNPRPVSKNHNVQSTHESPGGKRNQKSYPKSLPRALILTPTRELTLQVREAAKEYAKHLSLEVVSVLGGMPYREQLRQLSNPRKPVDIIIATPGRLIDYVGNQQLNLSGIETLVLDEADRMLDMGFVDDMKEIIAAISKSNKNTDEHNKHQTLLFTATMNQNLAHLAKSILHHPEHVEAKGKKITLENIEQRLHFADNEEHKFKILTHFLTNESIFKAIIFASTKRGVDSLARNLRHEGHDVGVLHGDMKQNQRNKTLREFRNNGYILVATDVAARGIDVPDISHVFNYDLPKFAEDYVHRIGRTGRAGKTGIAISFASMDERHTLRRIERFTQHAFAEHLILGLEPKKSVEREKSTNKKPRSSRQGFSKTGRSFSGDNKKRGDRDFKPRGEWQEKREGRFSKSKGEGRKSFGEDNKKRGDRDFKPRGEWQEKREGRFSKSKSEGEKSFGEGNKKRGDRDFKPRGEWQEKREGRFSKSKGDGEKSFREGNKKRGDRDFKPRGEWQEKREGRFGNTRSDGEKTFSKSRSYSKSSDRKSDHFSKKSSEGNRFAKKGGHYSSQKKSRKDYD